MTTSPLSRILLIDYLRQLRRSNPLLCFLITTILVLQLVITIAKLEVTPLFLYGMYSQQLPFTDSFTRVSIYINDQPLEYYHPPLRERQMLETNALNYEEMKSNGNTDILKNRMDSYPFISGLKRYPYITDRIYNSAASQEKFRQWLKHKCLGISRLQSGEVLLIQTWFKLDLQTMRLHPVKTQTLDVF